MRLWKFKEIPETDLPVSYEMILTQGYEIPLYGFALLWWQYTLESSTKLWNSLVWVSLMLNIILKSYKEESGPGSVVGIATGYGLDGPGIESRWGVRFSAPVQTGPGAHPASCTRGIGSFLGVKSGRGVTLTPHPLLVPRS